MGEVVDDDVGQRCHRLTTVGRGQSHRQQTGGTHGLQSVDAVFKPHTFFRVYTKVSRTLEITVWVGLAPFKVLAGEDGIKIVANPQKSRQIALLVIPVLAVVFSFDAKWDKLACDQFMKRFDMYTQRGGG